MNSFRTSLLTASLLLAISLLGQAVKEHTIINSLPLFLREGDRPQLNFILLNKKKKDWTGSSSLSLRDAKNKESVDGWFMNSVSNQYFTVDSSNQYELFFPIEVPFLYNQELNWQFTIESAEDSITSKGSIPIVSWPYEDSLNSSNSKAAFVTIHKKTQASNPIARGQKVLIEIEISIKKNVESLLILDEWAAGLVPEKAAIQLTGTTNKKFLENRTTKGRTIKFTNLAAGIYHLRYYAVATFPGDFNQPPALLYLNGASYYAARSSYEKLAIE